MTAASLIEWWAHSGVPLAKGEAAVEERLAFKRPDHHVSTDFINLAPTGSRPASSAHSGISSSPAVVRFQFSADGATMANTHSGARGSGVIDRLQNPVQTFPG
jgi:hypothetical protein